MKVILLNGSPRKEGNTAYILDQCVKEINAQNVEAEIISVGDNKYKACMACGQCGELKKCVINDGLNEIIEKIKKADGLITAAPVYFGTARGEIMSVMQRIGNVSMHDGCFLSWKVGGPIAVARRGGHTATLSEMLMFYFINEMIVPGSQYWNMVVAREVDTAKNDSEGMETVKLFAKNVALLINRLSK